jgi:hypothetical protein
MWIFHLMKMDGIFIIKDAGNGWKSGASGSIKHAGNGSKLWNLMSFRITKCLGSQSSKAEVKNLPSKLDDFHPILPPFLADSSPNPEPFELWRRSASRRPSCTASPCHWPHAIG